MGHSFRRLLVAGALGCGLATSAGGPTTATGTTALPGTAAPGLACSALCLNDRGSPVFGANMDHVTIDEGYVFLNPRGIERTSLDASVDGRQLTWISQYASLTFNLVAYNYAWAGLNEAGLVLSTMRLGPLSQLVNDHRLPLDSGVWVQYVLDTCETIACVVASNDRVRIITVDHYLVTDRWGNAVTIEFPAGRLVEHHGEALPVAVLTNMVYADALARWRLHQQSGQPCFSWSSSPARFCIGADRIADFVPAEDDDEAAVAYTFGALHAMRGEQFSEHSSQWNIVFDVRNRRAWFRTLDQPAVKYVDLAEFDLECGPPVQMLDIQEPLPGDARAGFFDFDFDLALQHFIGFCHAWGVSATDRDIARAMRRFADFPCRRPAAASRR
jgi:penicillin V acylase-like amidase (Ntn superfamily)